MQVRRIQATRSCAVSLPRWLRPGPAGAAAACRNQIGRCLLAVVPSTRPREGAAASADEPGACRSCRSLDTAPRTADAASRDPVRPDWQAAIRTIDCTTGNRHAARADVRAGPRCCRGRSWGEVAPATGSRREPRRIALPVVPAAIGEANRPAPSAGASEVLEDTDAAIAASS
jgi:hypothetical protein